MIFAGHLGSLVLWRTFTCQRIITLGEQIWETLVVEYLCDGIKFFFLIFFFLYEFLRQWVKFSDHLSYFCLWFLKILHELATFFKCFVYLIVIKFSFKHVSRISLFWASLCVTGITLFWIVLLPYVTSKENKKFWKTKII